MLLTPPFSLSRLTITTGSLEISCLPSAVAADRVVPERHLELLPQLNWIFRHLQLSLIIITFSFDPVAIRVFWTPYAIIKIAVKTKTTSEIPTRVITVVNFLEPKFLSVYLNGIFISSFPPRPEREKIFQN